MKPEIIFVASHPLTISAFLLPHIRALQSIASVKVITNSIDSNLFSLHGIHLSFVPIVRPIAPFSDVRAFWALYWMLRKNSPKAVHTISPKAGFLGMAAAWLARVPIRVHTFTGQVWVVRKGFMRWLLKSIDTCVALMATDILVDSATQRDFLVDQKVISARNSNVLGNGSICGVNTERFSPSESGRGSVRNELATTHDAIVCLFLGRLNRDKGVLDLANAFARVAGNHPKAELWIVGPDESGCFLDISEILKGVGQRVKRVEYTSMPERYMQAADLFCLPSYREGFGSSVIEAAACGLPTLASRIYGLKDAVVEGVTGWMHECGNIEDIEKQLNFILSDTVMISARGVAARKHVQQQFAEKIVVDAMLAFYQRKLF